MVKEIKMPGHKKDKKSKTYDIQIWNMAGTTSTDFPGATSVKIDDGSIKFKTTGDTTRIFGGFPFSLTESDEPETEED